MVIGRLNTLQKMYFSILTKESENSIDTALSCFDYEHYDFLIYLPHLQKNC